MLTDEELAAIRARCEAGLPGPWDHNCYSLVTAQVPHEHPWDACDGDGPENDGSCRAVVCWISQRPDQQRGDLLHSEEARGNREFIAHARADVSRLLGEIARLRVEIEQLRPSSEQTTPRTCDLCEQPGVAGFRGTFGSVWYCTEHTAKYMAGFFSAPHQSAGEP